MALKNLIKHILQIDAYDFNKYPYSTGQTFYTETNIFYEDIGDYRCAVVPSKLIASTTALATDTDLANNFAIIYDSSESPGSQYSIYYYDSAGVPNLISGGGGWTPPGLATQYDLLEFNGTDWVIANEIHINKIYNRADATTYIEFLEPISENPAYKVKINGKLDAELDCGGW